MWGAVSGGSWQWFRIVIKNIVTSVTSSKPFWDNPYTRARALRLMQEDVTDVTNVTPGSTRKANPPTHAASPLPCHTIFELGSSKAGEPVRRGAP